VFHEQAKVVPSGVSLHARANEADTVIGAEHKTVSMSMAVGAEHEVASIGSQQARKHEANWSM
jgi:hypothetical protein